MNSPVRNPLPRLCIVVVLLVWTGANLFTNIFRFQDLLAGNFANRSVSLFMAALVILLPLAISIWLLTTIMPRHPKSPPQSR